MLLDLPEGATFGIDQHAWAVGPKFLGIKMIPPGPHIISYGYSPFSLLFSLSPHYPFSLFSSFPCSLTPLLTLFFSSCSSSCSLALVLLPLPSSTSSSHISSLFALFYQLLIFACRASDTFGTSSTTISFFTFIEPRQVYFIISINISNNLKLILVLIIRS